MNNESNKSLGYLIVRVSTARGAIPLANATVSVRGSTPQNSGIVYSLESDISGLTPKLPLPAPPRSNSLSPNQDVAFSLWNIDVFAKGFITAHYSNVPVYSDITSIQSAELIPLGEGFSPNESFNESETPNL